MQKGWETPGPFIAYMGLRGGVSIQRIAEREAALPCFLCSLTEAASTTHEAECGTETNWCCPANPVHIDPGLGLRETSGGCEVLHFDRIVQGHRNCTRGCGCL